MTNLSSLQNEAAPVTGASRGIGRGIAVRLARSRLAALLSLSYSASASKVVRQIERAGSKAIALQVDCSDIKQIAGSSEKAIEHFGKTNVCNAGVESFGNIGEFTSEKNDRFFGLNTHGQFFVAQKAYKHISHGRRLILMSSISANLRGVPGHSVYSVSKAVVEAFRRCLPEDLGSRKLLLLE